jgi:hypothetical protein
MPILSPEVVVRTLMPEPGGLSAPEILRRLRKRISQPTLWRVLDGLRSEGRITVEGRARATRYRVASPTALATRRSLHMHRSVARRLVRQPELLTDVRTRLEDLRRINPHGRMYHDRWASLLDGPFENLLRTLTEDSVDAESLRKESPFTTLVTTEARRRAFADIR